MPVGTNITLTATASKDLDPASIKIEAHKLHKAGIPLVHSPLQMLDPHLSTRFETFASSRISCSASRYRRCGRTAASGHHPRGGFAAEIREFAPDKIVRRVQGGYMVTVTARIPFLAEVEDDHGLNEVHYAYTISQAESGRLNRRGAWPLLGGEPQSRRAGTAARIDRSGLPAPAGRSGRNKIEDGPVHTMPCRASARSWTNARRT